MGLGEPTYKRFLRSVLTSVQSSETTIPIELLEENNVCSISLILPVGKKEKEKQNEVISSVLAC